MLLTSKTAEMGLDFPFGLYYNSKCDEASQKG